MCRSTLQRAFRLALRASGVKKDAHPHTLRHYADLRTMPTGTEFPLVEAWFSVLWAA